MMAPSVMAVSVESSEASSRVNPVSGPLAPVTASVASLVSVSLLFRLSVKLTRTLMVLPSSLSLSL